VDAVSRSGDKLGSDPKRTPLPIEQVIVQRDGRRANWGNYVFSYRHF
jgi:hypothetical protein